MADGLKGAAQLFGEAIVKPTVDTVGEMIEGGVQSITGSQKQDPAQKQQDGNTPNPQQLAADDNRKKKNVMQFLQNYQVQQKRLAMQNQQTEKEKEEEQKQEKQAVKQFEFKKKEDSNQRQIDIQRAKTRSERKAGGAG